MLYDVDEFPSPPRLTAARLNDKLYYNNMSKSARGFASMPQEKRRAIAGLGGKAAHKQGTAHTWIRAEAQRAGRKGGLRRKASGIPDLKAGQR
jgi:general stress protein YciG